MKRLLIAGGLLAALVIAPFAVAAGEGNPLKGGARNPSPNESQSLTRETEIIANNGTYGTRQSNKSDTGGGAIYGCRARTGDNSNPCIRANNLSNGRAFEFHTDGAETGQITAGRGGDTVKPFTTNATGVATGLNADRVDGLDGSQLAPRIARVAADGTLTPGRGVTASTRTAAGTYQVTFAEDINQCAFNATVVGGATAQGFASVEPTDARNVTVRTADASAGNPLADRGFHLTAFC